MQSNCSSWIKFKECYAAAVARMECPQSIFLLAVRLFWGWQFFVAGKGKLMNLDKTTEFFTGMNIPFPAISAFCAGATECFGGLLLLVGLGSRLVSIPLIFTMLVAYATAHSDALKNIGADPDAFMSQGPFLFLFAALIVLLFGPGKLSLDYWICKKSCCPSTPSEQKTTSCCG